MKTYLPFLVAFFLLQIGFSQGLKGDTWAEALKNKQASVILTNVHLANFSESKDGKGSGVCFDIMDDFAAYVKDKYGVKVTYKYRPVSNTANFQLFLSAVESSEGGVFGLGDITITEERKKTFDFTPPYFANRAVLVTQKKVPQLTSLSKIPTTFKGMKAISQGGTTHDKRLKDLQKKYQSFEIVYGATSVDKTFRVLTSPRFFTYIDLPNYLQLSSEGKDIKRHAVGDVKGESYGFIMPKGSDWAPIITEFFEADGGYVKSDDYNRVLSKNLSAEVVRLLNSLSD